MANLPLQETLIREIASLPDERKEEVLAFVRFLKIGLADEDTLQKRFETALNNARARSLEKGITEQDIQAEIRAVRSGQ